MQKSQITPCVREWECCEKDLGRERRWEMWLNRVGLTERVMGVWTYRREASNLFLWSLKSAAIMEGTYVFLLMASQPSSKQYPLWMLSLGKNFQSSLNIFSFLKVLANDRSQIFLLIRISALRALGWVSCFCHGTDLKYVSGTQMHRWRSPWTFLHTGSDFNHYRYVYLHALQWPHLDLVSKFSV